MKKRVFSWLMTLCLAACLWTPQALAYEEGDLIYYGYDGTARCKTELIDDTWLICYPWQDSTADTCIMGAYFGSEKTVKIPGKVNGKPVTILSGYSIMSASTGDMQETNGLLLPDNTTTKKIILPCTLEQVHGINGPFWNAASTADPTQMTYVLPSDLDSMTWIFMAFGGGRSMEGNTYPPLNVIVEKNSAVYDLLMQAKEEAAPGQFLNVKAVTANNADIMATHNWNSGKENADGHIVYTCKDCGAKHTTKTNKITASNKYASYSTAKKTVKLNASAKGSSKLTYKSSNAGVKVSTKGVVTLPAKFSGKVTITITAKDPNRIYDTITKKVTVTVPKATAIKTLTSTKAGKATLTWKKVSGVTGYQVSYKVGTTEKKVKVSGADTVKNTFSSLKKGKKYTFRIRTYKTVSAKTYYSAWCAKKTVSIKK